MGILVFIGHSIGICGSVDLPNSGDYGSPIKGRQLFRIGRRYSKTKFPDDEIIIGPKFFKRQLLCSFDQRGFSEIIDLLQGSGETPVGLLGASVGLLESFLIDRR
jgi:hypothetical protein